MSDGDAAAGSPPRGDVREMLERLGNQHGVPLSAGIEISDHCNESCAHCYQIQGKKGELSTAHLKRVIDELADMGVLLLTFAGGEATLRKDFIELVAYARSRGFSLRIFSNGLNMTRELARSLGEHAVQSVEISLYSTRADVHDFITGVPGSFDKTVAGVRHLVAERVGVTIKTPIMSINEHELDAYARFAGELGAAYSFSPGELMPREGGDRSPQIFTPSDQIEIDLQRRLGSSDEPDWTAAAMSQSTLALPPCTAGHDIHIEPNGELRPCTMLDVHLGDAVRDGVAHARTTNPDGHALRSLTWAQLHGCRDCDLRPTCAHCYASALASVADALGPYPGGCRAARLAYEARSGTGLRVVSAPGRDPLLGPYRLLEPGVIETFDDIITPEDDALAARLGWARKPGGGSAAPELAARPGELIQIRRPGRKTPRLERVPGGRLAE